VNPDDQALRLPPHVFCIAQDAYANAILCVQPHAPITFCIVPWLIFVAGITNPPPSSSLESRGLARLKR
jgi:hypothetical protein